SAAVAGAIYIMGTEITEISKGDKLKINIGNSHVANVDSIISSHMHKNLISNSTQFQKESKKFARAVIILNGRGLGKGMIERFSISETEDSIFETPVYILQTPAISKCCPDNTTIIHAWCDVNNSTHDAYANIKKAITYAFNSKFLVSCNDNQEDSGNALDVNISRATGISDLDKDTLFSAYFCINDTYSNQSNEINSDINRNILFVNDRCNELDFDNNIIDAKEMFEKLCPGVGFMST
ncbi:hypothetical protein AYI70_g6108, partial [Smittium culicis]